MRPQFPEDEERQPTPWAGLWIRSPPHAPTSGCMGREAGEGGVELQEFKKGQEDCLGCKQGLLHCHMQSRRSNMSLVNH